MKNFCKICLCSIMLSVLYVSSLFISEIISYKSTILSYAYLCAISLIYSLLLISENQKHAVSKWLISIPFSYLILQYFWKTHYSIRALNWVIPYYGRQTAGGNFAGFISMIFFSVLCLIGIIISLNITPKEKEFKKFGRIQLSIGCISVIIIVLVVIILEKQFPSYAFVLN